MAAEFFVLAAAIACFSHAQSDTYWHLASGRAMAQSGRVMLTDEFSHTNFGARWANYEWLSQVVFYDAYRLGGMPLLTALCALLAVGGWALAWKLTRGATEDRALLLAFVLPLVTPGWSLRPHVFSLFLLVAVVHIILRERYLLLLPVFAVWANLHGAVAYGFVALAADFAAALIAGRGRGRCASYGVLAFGATLLTPLGTAYWPEIWRSLSRSPVNLITEWMSPGLTIGFAYFWLAALALVWLAATRWSRLERREDRILVILSLLLLVLAVRASRNIVPFGLLAAPALSVLLWQKPAQAAQAGGPRISRASLARVLLFAGSVVVAAVVVGGRWTRTPPPDDWAPLSNEAIQAIRACPTPIYNQFDTGGFIIWFVPEQRVFLDNRQDPYPDQLMRAQREATTPASLRELFARYRVRCAVLESDSREIALIRTLEWTERYRDRRWVVMTEAAARLP